MKEDNYQTERRHNGRGYNNDNRRGGYNNNRRGGYNNHRRGGGRYNNNDRRGGGRYQRREYPQINNEPTVEELFKKKGSAGINFDNYDDIPVNKYGDNIPEAAETFDEMNLPEKLLSNIKLCGYEKPTPVQKHCVPISVQKRDIMTCAETGSGKTAGFLIPIIDNLLKSREEGEAQPMEGPQDPQSNNMAQPKALIMSPTRELTTQIYNEARKFCYKSGLRVVVVYGGKPIQHQVNHLQKGVDIIVATPGRLSDLMRQGYVTMEKIQFMVLDEADRMLDMGFEPQIREIVEGEKMPQADFRQTMMFSATFPDDIQALARQFMQKNYIFLTVGRVGSATQNVTQVVKWVEDADKMTELQKILADVGKEKTLIFVKTKRQCRDMPYQLKTAGFRSETIHGDKRQEQREAALKRYKSGSAQLLIATDVAARGLDIHDITQVINYDMPENIDDYVHRIGRTGRAGREGTATGFFNQSNYMIASELLETLEKAKQTVPEWLPSMAYKKKGGSHHGGRFGHRRGGGGHRRYNNNRGHHNRYNNRYNNNGGGNNRYNNNGGGNNRYNNNGGGNNRYSNNNNGYSNNNNNGYHNNGHQNNRYSNNNGYSNNYSNNY